MRAKRAAMRWFGRVAVALGMIPITMPTRAAAQVGRPGQDAGPRGRAMLVGIERYEEQLAFPRCRGAARDAAELARWLIATAGWGPESVLLLTDQDPAALGFEGLAPRPLHRRPTKANLDWAARQWLGTGARPGDVLVVFFAGQAIGLPEGPDDRPGQPPRDYLLPVDARAADVDQTGWRFGEAIEDLASRGEFSILCLLDTSPAGRVHSPVLLGQPARAASGERLLRGVVRWPGVTAWLGSAEGPALETVSGAGVFTSALLAELGTRRAPRNLLACLERLRLRPELAAQGFRTAGGFGPELTLWPGPIRPARPKAEPLLQRGHADRVMAVAFTAAGAQAVGAGMDLVTASMDSTVRLWRAADGTLLRVLPRVTNGAWSLALSGDGTLLVAGGGKGDLLFFDLERERFKTVTGPPPHPGVVDRIAILPDGRHVVTLDNKGQSLVWDAGGETVRGVGRTSELGGRLLVAASRPGPVAFALVVPGKPAAESVRLFDARGSRVADLPGPSTRVTALDLAADGTHLALATEDGRVIEYDVPGGKARRDRKLAVAVTSLAIKPLWLVAAAGPMVHIFLPEGGGKGIDLSLDEAIARVALSADGRRIAACGRNQGSLRAWEIAADGVSARRLTLDAKAGGEVVSLGFSPGGEALVAGDQDGGIRLWDLPAGAARPPILAGRGRVRHLAVAPDERAVLQVNDDGLALLWEFGKGRGTRPILGSFLPGGGFLPGGDLVLIDRRGDVAVHDRATLTRRPPAFERPMAADGRRRSTLRFHSLAVSPDGSRVVAGSRDAPLACVWATATGKLAVPPIRGHEDKVRAVGFSGDGRLLLTGSDDGVAKVWDIAAAEPKAVRVLQQVNSDSPGPKPVITAALSPVVAARAVLGREDGQVELWEPGGLGPAWSTRLEGEVRAVAFSPDGTLLAAAGDDRQIVLRSVTEPNRPVLFGTRPHHYERIQALAFWPKGRLLASASDDTTVRFWRIRDGALLGTLAAWRSGTDWVVFTPDGLFDASAQGERSVTWRPEPARDVAPVAAPAIARLEQVRAQRCVFDLAETLSRGEDPKPLARMPEARPPQLILEPVSAPSPRRRQVDLRIRLSEAGITDLRLYHNGVAVFGDLKPVGRIAVATLTLVSGPNRIYALAGREGRIDGRSQELLLNYDGPTPGRLHVLALGVSRYRNQALRYAGTDARAVAAFLRPRSATPGLIPPGEPIVLVDEEVRKGDVERKFQELRSRVRGRPEDTVVVFLAGHTEIRSGFFCLLLPPAELPAGPEITALDGPATAPSARRPGLPLDDPTVLPYAVIHNNLRFVEALNRLVIVDACQAEGLFDDPGVRASVQRRIRRAVAHEAHPARTSYILATRRGERAAEAEPLEHGLLTYVLLRGMGERDLRPIRDLAIFEQYPTADLDHDGWVQTGELRQYVAMTIPVLARRFPGLVLRGGAADQAARPDSALTQEFEGASFPLIEITPPPVRAGAR
jgi:WD40 repeat protein